MNKTIATIVALTLLTACGTTKEASEKRRIEKAQEEQALKEALDKHEFRVEVNRVLPMSLPPETVTDYDVTIRHDSIFSCLPFRGRAYNLPYGGGDGLRFDSKITHYAEHQGKHTRDITIETKTNEDTYTFYISISASGMAQISVNSRNRETITFDGNAYPVEE